MLSKNKVILMLMVMVLSVSMLAGCTVKANEEAIVVTESSEEASIKVIRVGTGGAYNPWCFKENDVLKGFEIDVWNEIASRTGYEVEFSIGKFSSLVGQLDAGKIDTVAHQLSIRPDRLEKYDFTEPYAYSNYDFIVKDGSSYEKIEDLKGKKVGAWLGGNGEKTLKALNEAYGLDLDMKFYDGTPLEKEVEIDRLDVCWQGAVKSQAAIDAGDLKVHLLKADTEIGTEINAYPFVKDSDKEEMREAVTKAIIEMHEDGTLSELSQKWFNLDTTRAPEAK